MQSLPHPCGPRRPQSSPEKALLAETWSRNNPLLRDYAKVEPMLEPGIRDLCQSFDVDIDEFLPRIPSRFRKNAAIYLSGSLIEGFGNSASDLDVMIVSSLPLGAVPCTIRKDYARIDMIAGEHRRIDLEYIMTSSVTRPLGVIAGLDIPVDFVAERVDEREELLIHRLTRARPVFHTSAYGKLRQMVPEQQFRRYMVKRCLHKIDGATLDIGGFLRKGDGLDALIRLFDVVDLATDAYRFSFGMTNPLPKWRIRSLKQIAETRTDSNASAVLEFYLAHRVFRQIEPGMSNEAIRTYARDILYWTDCLMRRVYD